MRESFWHNQRTGRVTIFFPIAVIGDKIGCVEFLIRGDYLRSGGRGNEGWLRGNGRREEETDPWELAIAGDACAARAGNRPEIERFGSFA